MAKSILKFFNFFLGNLLEDFLILLGLLAIIYTTFILNVIAGMYLTGGILLILGVLLAKKPPERR